MEKTPHTGQPSARTVSLIPTIPRPPRLRRVAAYARVSLDNNAMLHSLAAQVSHYKERITRHPGWEFAGVYADQGLSGTRVSRPEFQRLLADCREHRIDLILVKSISRFARNTVTLLETVRELSSLGVEVWFERENIQSLSGDGELLLSILASFAQEESLSVSENCRWRVQHDFAKGKPVGRQVYGYRVQSGAFTILPDEADVVRRIFSMFLEGMGRPAIARALNADGIPSPKGGKWTPGMLYYLLRNEKYAGDLLLQKYYSQDHLTKKTLTNRGEKAQYMIQDDHPAIIDRDTFEQALAEVQRRGGKRPPCAEHSPLSGKVICGLCGKPFVRKTGNAGTKYAKPVWMCGTAARLGIKACPARRIPEKVLFDAIATQQPTTPITVYPDGRLLYAAQEFHWENPSRRQVWDTDRRTQAALHRKEGWKK